jgi:REP element-mobilizing transposase RayT
VARGPLAARFPVHVTVRLGEGLPNLRRRRSYAALRAAFCAGGDRFGFRLVHFSVQSNHVHWIAETQDRRALVRGLTGLLVRVAKGLNRVWGRRGRVFDDRYHEHVLRTPREVRNAIHYVLQNARRHGIALAGVDPFSSGAWFDGWATVPGGRDLREAGIVVRARTWLLAVGWRRCGLVPP